MKKRAKQKASYVAKILSQLQEFLSSLISKASVQVLINTWSAALRKHNQHIYSEVQVREAEPWGRYPWQNFAFLSGLQNCVLSNNIMPVVL